jgi:hypothetical protein
MQEPRKQQPRPSTAVLLRAPTRDGDETAAAAATADSMQGVAELMATPPAGMTAEEEEEFILRLEQHVQQLEERLADKDGSAQAHRLAQEAEIAHWNTKLDQSYVALATRAASETSARAHRAVRERTQEPQHAKDRKGEDPRTSQAG